MIYGFLVLGLCLDLWYFISFQPQVKLESRILAKQYGSIEVDAMSKVNKDLKFDRTREFLYVMTAKKVRKCP